MHVSLFRPIANDVGMVSQWFGDNPEYYVKWKLAGHNGLDYAVPMMTPILAAHDGKVYIEPYDPEGYGYCVRVISDRYLTLYAHLTKITVSKGDMVSALQPIAFSGNTGVSTGPHMHFGFKLIGMSNPAYLGWIDPVPFRDI